jgi:hypothetical protein
MTPEEYVGAVQDMARRREYGSLIAFAERVGPDVEDQLTADMVISQARSRVNTA